MVFILQIYSSAAEILQNHVLKFVNLHFLLVINLPTTLLPASPLLVLIWKGCKLDSSWRNQRDSEHLWPVRHHQQALHPSTFPLQHMLPPPTHSPLRPSTSPPISPFLHLSTHLSLHFRGRSTLTRSTVGACNMGHLNNRPSELSLL